MKKFETVAASKNSENWDELTQRKTKLYGRSDDVRNEFARDYTRILHSLAYRRLKHKTQVFYNIGNDHICTRMEHVAHVESVSHTIADELGLNVDLTKAIAMGHDLGHAPFGHQGEKIISRLTEDYLGTKFWHEQNGLRFVDDIEMLEDEKLHFRNLDLTYAVRDGIISHCGEVNKNCLKPRKELFDLKEFDSVGKYESATWEGCVVKFSDKIAYVGRDIEDAKRLGFLEEKDIKKLEEFAKMFKFDAINTTVIIHSLVTDICKNSSIEKGICLSEKYAENLDEIKQFNYEKIYKSERFLYFEEYASLVINSIFRQLVKAFKGADTFIELGKMEKFYPALATDFQKWLVRYVSHSIVPEKYKGIVFVCNNKKLYGTLENKSDYILAIIDYISGMTDGYAIKLYNELITF